MLLAVAGCCRLLLAVAGCCPLLPAGLLVAAAVASAVAAAAVDAGQVVVAAMVAVTHAVAVPPAAALRQQLSQMLLQLLLLHVSLLLRQPSKNFTKQQTSHDFLVYSCATIRSASAELLALVFKPGVRHINILLYASAATKWLLCVIRNVTAFSARGMYEN